MSIHVKTATGLVEIGGKVTKEKVVSALGYEPANKTVENQLNEHENNKTVHISQAEREQWNSNTNNLNAHAANNNNHISQDERVKWNNKSDFTGDYNDLVNAPDITEDDSNNLLVSDTKGNIIMRVDANGITTTEVSADKIITSNIEYDNSKIEITDKYDNVLLRVDESGLTTTDINAKKLTLNGNDVEPRLDSLDSHVNQHTASINSINSFNQQIENTLTNHKNDTNIHITANERKTWNDDISKNKQDISSLNNNINQHIANTSNPHNVTKAQLGLGNVDNTSDINKPVSEAQQIALNALKNELTTEIDSDSDSFLITDKDGRINFKVDVNGVETTNLNAKDDISIAGSSLTSTINSLTANINSLDNDVNVRINSAISAEESRSNQMLATHEAKNIHITEQERTKWNAADTRSSTTESNLNSHASNQTNPHNVTKSQVGLGNVDNTSDIDKPVSTQQQTALNNLKTELSESMVSESGEWIIVDKNDRINTKVDSNGLSSHTINATEDILLKSESLTSKFNTINNSLNLINSELDTVPNQISSAITNANLNQYAKQTSLDATNQKVGELEENLATKATISDLNSHTHNVYDEAIYDLNQEVAIDYSRIEFDTGSQVVDSGIDLSVYQTKADGTLTTTAKTVSGAINELDASIDNEATVRDEADTALDAKISQISNPNLLINGDFRNPVNQRGLSTYEIADVWKTIYTIDRWKLTGQLSSVVVNDGYIQITPTDDYECYLIQEFETGVINEGLTLTINVTNMTGSITVYMKDVNGTNHDEQSLSVGKNVLYFNGGTMKRLYVYVHPNSSVGLEYIKLEQGSIATPFVPRPYGEELALCQRYYWRINDNQLGMFMPAMPVSDTKMRLLLHVGNTLRTTPTVSQQGLNYIDHSTTGWVKPNSVSVFMSNEKYVVLDLTFSSAILTNLKLSDVIFYDGYIALDAEIY